MLQGMVHTHRSMTFCMRPAFYQQPGRSAPCIKATAYSAADAQRCGVYWLQQLGAQLSASEHWTCSGIHVLTAFPVWGTLLLQTDLGPEVLEDQLVTVLETKAGECLSRCDHNPPLLACCGKQREALTLRVELIVAAVHSLLQVLQSRLHAALRACSLECRCEQQCREAHKTSHRSADHHTVLSTCRPPGTRSRPDRVLMRSCMVHTGCADGRPKQANVVYQLYWTQSSLPSMAGW